MTGYLLIEFQSMVDRYMAVRMLAYLSLLYQDLVRTGQLAAEGRLPPVLPMVLYNGSKRWDAPSDLADLIVPVPGGLERYRPRLTYFLEARDDYRSFPCVSDDPRPMALRSLYPLNFRRVDRDLTSYLFPC